MNADDEGATALADEGPCGWPSDAYFADLDGWGDDRAAADHAPINAPGDDR